MNDLLAFPAALFMCLQSQANEPLPGFNVTLNKKFVFKTAELSSGGKLTVGGDTAKLVLTFDLALTADVIILR